MALTPDEEPRHLPVHVRFRDPVDADIMRDWPTFIRLIDEQELPRRRNAGPEYASVAARRGRTSLTSRPTAREIMPPKSPSSKQLHQQRASALQFRIWGITTRAQQAGPGRAPVECISATGKNGSDRTRSTRCRRHAAFKSPKRVAIQRGRLRRADNNLKASIVRLWFQVDECSNVHFRTCTKG
jgi:hypothetical protein